MNNFKAITLFKSECLLPIRNITNYRLFLIKVEV